MIDFGGEPIFNSVLSEFDHIWDMKSQLELHFILFVLILNLIGVGDYEQIRKNFILSEDFNSVGITIDKIDSENDIYCYYCIFGKANF